MRRLLFWFLFGVFVTTGLMMMTFGVLFISTIITSPLRGEGIFTSLLLGIILLLTGGGLLSSTIAESFHRFSQRP